MKTCICFEYPFRVLFGLWGLMLFFWGMDTATAQIKGEATYLVKYQADYALKKADTSWRTVEPHILLTGSEVSFYGSPQTIYYGRRYRKIKGLGPVARKRWLAEDHPELYRGFSEEDTRRSTRRFLPIVYKDLKRDKVEVVYQMVLKFYEYEESQVPLKWKFIDETKEIGGYKAQRAEVDFGGRHWIAWFTTEIPIFDGPYVFYGLPGLIVSLYDTEREYAFNLQSVQKLKNAFHVDAENSHFERISKSEFKKSYRNYMAHPLGEFEHQYLKMDNMMTDRQGNQVKASEFFRKRKRELQSRNNYIEEFEL